jgi:hypothetical protein
MYVAPTDSDNAMKELFTEIAAIQKLIPENSVSLTITPEQWQQYWKVVNEETSSSESGLHFGHYIVGCQSYLITHYHAAGVTVTLAQAFQLERWSCSLSVMLEKTLRVTLVTKLHTILLMEGDYNATNKIIYGDRMIRNARGYCLMPKEIFSKKNKWQTTARCAKIYFMTLLNKQESQPQLRWSTHPNVMIESHTPWHL